MYFIHNELHDVFVGPDIDILATFRAMFCVSMLKLVTTTLHEDDTQNSNISTAASVCLHALQDNACLWQSIRWF